MAEVWMGRRPAMGGASKAVAIKLLAQHIADDPAYRQMFIDEARLSMLLTNSNVVQVFDVGEVAGECFMVMEWVDGLNLADLTRNMLAKGESPALELSAHVIGEVLRGLAYAHALHHDGGSATIVHRDVSPQNVLCSVSGEVKLADFGVARLAREETSGLHVKGKLRYMAPEQLRGRSREPTVDLYAVGAMLHELLSGEKFRKTRDEGDLYSMALSGEYPPLPASVPPELVTVCKRLLEPDATLRVQTAEAALELLGRWPGYRNGSIELGRLVREYSGIAGPRSGIVHFPASPPPSTSLLSSADTLGAGANSIDRTVLNPSEPTVHTGTPTELVTPRESGPLTDQGVTAETRTWTTSGTGEPTRPELPVHASASGPVHGPARGASLGLMLAAGLAVVFGVFGLGVGLEWWGPRAGERAAIADDTGVGNETGARDETEDPEKVEEPKEVEAPPIEPPPEPKVLDPEIDPPATTGAAPIADDSQNAIEADPPPTRQRNRPKPDADLTPAEVELKAGEFTFVFIKVAGREFVAQPTLKVEIKPGRHTVYLRQLETDAWQKAGTIKIEPGKRYKMRMTKTPGLKLEPVG
jgi:serine/threonine protein kinase